jgi:hypothetical protein
VASCVAEMCSAHAGRQCMQRIVDAFDIAMATKLSRRRAGSALAAGLAVGESR